MNVSVVIPTYDRAEVLRKAIAALVNQETDGIRYEIRIVQDGPGEATTKVLEEARRNHPDLIFHYALPHSGGPAGPRNFGIREATGELLIMLDDDIIPDPDFVQQHWEYHQKSGDEKTVVVGELYLTPGVRRDPMSFFCDFPYHQLTGPENLGYLFFWSGNMSLRRDFMLRDGMFLDDGTLPLLEDMECGYRLEQRGMKLRFHPKARGVHEFRMKRESIPGKGYRTGQSQYTLTMKIPDRGVKERFGILSPDLPIGLLIKRMARRTAFLLLDNPLVAAVLRGLGAEGDERNGLTDFYNYMIFRRNILAGYRATRNLSESVSNNPTLPLKKEAGV